MYSISLSRQVLLTILTYLQLGIYTHTEMIVWFSPLRTAHSGTRKIRLRSHFFWQVYATDRYNTLVDKCSGYHSNLGEWGWPFLFELDLFHKSFQLYFFLFCIHILIGFGFDQDSAIRYLQIYQKSSLHSFLILSLIHLYLRFNG